MERLHNPLRRDIQPSLIPRNRPFMKYEGRLSGAGASLSVLSIFRRFVDPDPYSQFRYASGSTHVNTGIPTYVG